MIPSPFEWRTGPSQIAAHLVTPGWVPPKPKEKAAAAQPVNLDALRKYRAENHTQAECAAKFGISKHSVRKLLAAPKFQRTISIIVDAEEIRRLRNEGNSLRAIAEQFVCSQWVLRRRLGEKTPPEIKAKVRAKSHPSQEMSGKGRSIYMTDAQFAAFNALGGGNWLRTILSRRPTADTRKKSSRNLDKRVP